jgi:hypothetical protein
MDRLEAEKENEDLNYIMGHHVEERHYIGYIL